MKKDREFTKEIYSYLIKDPPLLKDIFQNKINKLGLSQRQAEIILGMEKKSLQSILNKEAKRVDASNLIKLGHFLSLGFNETLKIFAANLSPEQIGEIEKTRRRTFIVEHFDLKSLKSMKFIERINDFEHIENRIKRFFNIESIYDYDRDIGAAFSRTKNSYNSQMLNFWVKSAFAYLEKLDNPNEYDRTRLLDIVSKIKPYSKNVQKGLRIVSQALFVTGVTVIFQPYLPTTQIRGATLMVNEKPCIVITNFNKNYATLWFALLHELYHVLFELDKIEQNVFHLTGEPNLFLMEEAAADNFARQYFLSNDKAKYIYRYIKNPLLVSRYAEINNINESLIYNFYCYDQQQLGKNKWQLFRKFLPDTKLALREININIWNNDTLYKSLEQTKSITTK